MAKMRGLFLLVLASCVGLAAACADEKYPDFPARNGENAGADGGASIDAPGACMQAHGQSYPARSRVMSADAGAAGGDVVFVSELVQQFQSACGACHGPTVAPQGGFQIATKADFLTRMTPAVLAHVTSNGGPGDPTPMPPLDSPTGKLFRDRALVGDPVRDLAVLIQEWLDAGSPSSFTRPDSTADGGAGSGFTLTTTSGNAMTNIGNCVPTKELVAVESTKSSALDAMFASAHRAAPGADVSVPDQLGLPLHLSDTDLFTFESRALAEHGVLSYAPAYPLWSDNAGKLRHVRVPRGTSIHFDKVAQRFQIPPNTRFYKTFMKPVVEVDGSIRWKKIETRLIVARPNPIDDDDTKSPPALFGTYRWNDAETDAILVQTLLRNGQPFGDTVLQYVVDEALAADLLGAKPKDSDEALLEGHAARHYAIPSSERCFECHRGSPSRDFVLGFNPLQIRRRETGTGGTIEPASADELSQLQRFIDYGLITGIDSMSDVLRLEESQGTRTPRNDYELVAQGYMVGNCAHCHNPHGDPTVGNPVLQGVLDFLPSKDGGIFQFPLERTSPRITRGGGAAYGIPYITPSLLDLPDPNAPIGEVPLLAGSIDDNGVSLLSAVYAPWRSLIYRNVDAAFSYTQDLALFPHMPRNTPGYDVRARQVMSDWMVSIPAVLKQPAIPEYAMQSDGHGGVRSWDLGVQPFVEVHAGEARYDEAVAGAKARLDVLHTGANPALPPPSLGNYSRYADPGDTFDILDPAVVLDPVCRPIPEPTVNNGSNPYPYAQHAHWVSRDLTDPPGPWKPRRSDWPDVLVDQKPESSPDKVCKDPDALLAAKRDEIAAVTLLQSKEATLDSIRDFATTKTPFGLWKAKPACDFSNVPTASAFASAPPQWMAHAKALAPTAPVYMQSPGASVFKMICINCHGPLADSNGRMANNLAEMTGGSARVANFRQGFFGPETSPGQNMLAEFAARTPEAWSGVKPEDAAARYMAWMALGGTKATIPDAILTLIGTTTVLGERRGAALRGSANMLSNAKQICMSLLGPYEYQSAHAVRTPGFDFDPSSGHAYLDVDNPRLIRANGDAEMWMQLCNRNNPPPVHVIRGDKGDHMDAVLSNAGDVTDDGTKQLIPWNSYLSAGESVACAKTADCAAIAASAVCNASSGKCELPVGNDHGGIDATLLSTNTWPWCVKSDTPMPGLPLCPAHADSVSASDANAWAVRGAINAGFSVFLYLQWLETHGPDPDYDQCESLQSANDAGSH